MQAYILVPPVTCNIYNLCVFGEFGGSFDKCWSPRTPLTGSLWCTALVSLFSDGSSICTKQNFCLCIYVCVCYWVLHFHWLLNFILMLSWIFFSFLCRWRVDCCRRVWISLGALGPCCPVVAACCGVKQVEDFINSWPTKELVTQVRMVLSFLYSLGMFSQKSFFFF